MAKNLTTLLHLDTPLLRSLALSRLVDKQVLLKIDALQPSGSFKLRGIGAACQEYKRQGKTRFVSSSGGNAGLVVSDLDALDACEQFLNDHRVLVEPACGASLAVLDSERRRMALSGLKAPLVVVCGGVTATLDKIREWRAAAEQGAG